MDEKFKELLENKKNAQQKLENSTNYTEFNLNLEILNNATNTVNTYISYKKAEDKYNEKVKRGNEYYNIINEMREIKC